MPERTYLEITNELNEIAGAGDHLVQELYKLTGKWEQKGVGVEALEPVLRFMESHPDLDYGSPGPLVQFAETFGMAGEGRDYEEKLIASLDRSPTLYTIWMLNRVINAKLDPEEKGALVSIMEGISKDTAVEPFVRERAAECLEWQAHSGE
jgi:hypothetical protein